MAALGAFAVTGLVYAALTVGPAQSRLAQANTLPPFVRQLHARGEGVPRLGTYLLASPNVVFYADKQVTQIGNKQVAAVTEFLESDPEAVLLVPEQHFADLESRLPAGYGVVARTMPVFRKQDVLAVGRTPPDAPRTASTMEVTR